MQANSRKGSYNTIHKNYNVDNDERIDRDTIYKIYRTLVYNSRTKKDEMLVY